MGLGTTSVWSETREPATLLNKFNNKTHGEWAGTQTHMDTERQSTASLETVEEADEAMRSIARLFHRWAVARSDLDVLLVIASLETSDLRANRQLRQLRNMFVMRREIQHRQALLSRRL